MKTYKITEDTANAVLSYLATRPYSEVFELVGKVQGIQLIVEEVAKEPTEVKKK